MKKILLLTVPLLLVAAAASASYPNRHQMRTVEELAYQLHAATRVSYQAAERNRHHLDRREAHALRKLGILERRARHFHHEVSRYHRRPAHTEGDYRGLITAYNDVAYTFEDLHATAGVVRSFQRVERLVHQLDAYYGGRYSPRGRRGHGRHPGHYDRGRGHYERGRGHYDRGRGRRDPYPTRYEPRRDEVRFGIYLPNIFVEGRLP